jgi:tRNA-guanine family transglycosylase
MVQVIESLKTPRGVIHFPAFFPVTTFGNKFPIDHVIRPYIPRFSCAMMVSHHYAQKIKKQNHPVFIDSGGFASLFNGSQIIKQTNGTFGILTRNGTLIEASSVLYMQENQADIGATLDFVIPRDMPYSEAREIQKKIVMNATWALTNRHNQALKLFASIQAWDQDSLRWILDKLIPLDFDGFSLGGMVPRIKTPEFIFEMVATYRELEKERPLHIFGIGSPPIVKELFDHGASSVDSSSYVRYAVSKKYLDPVYGEYYNFDEILDDLTEHCDCAICHRFSKEYLAMPGELNTMALALHNLAATTDFLEIGVCHDT